MEYQENLSRELKLFHLLCSSFEREVMIYQAGIIDRKIAAKRMDEDYLAAKRVLAAITISKKDGLEDEMTVSYDNALRKLQSATIRGMENTENFWKMLYC